MAGQPTIQETKQLGEKIKNSRTRPYLWNGVAQGANVEETYRINSNLYPYKPLPTDPYDSEWNIRREISVPGSQMVSSARPLPWTEEEIDYLRRKRDAEEYAAFQSWLGTKFPITDPANRDLLKKIVPEYFSVRAANLREQINLSARYANLRLVGPETEDDLLLIYEVETGRVKLPDGPFHDPMAWMRNEYNITNQANDLGVVMSRIASANSRRYQAGLFSPFRLLTYTDAPFAPNADNMSDGWGDSRNSALGPTGAHMPIVPSYGNYSGPDLGYFSADRGNNQAHVTNDANSNLASLPGAGRKLKYEQDTAAANRHAQKYGYAPIVAGANANIVHNAGYHPLFA